MNKRKLIKYRIGKISLIFIILGISILVQTPLSYGNASIQSKIPIQRNAQMVNIDHLKDSTNIGSSNTPTKTKTPTNIIEQSSNIPTNIDMMSSDILKKIQPLLVPANRINPDKPLYDSQNHKNLIYIYKLPGTNPTVLVFQSSGAVDCDGQLSSQCNTNTDPWYQDQTSFVQSNGKPLNAAILPYYVLPVAGSRYFDYSKNDIHGGQLGLIMYGNNKNYGVFGDESADQNKIGEISYSMASSLGINPNPHYGGVPSGVTYIVFTGSENVVSPIESHDKAIYNGNIAMKKMLAQLKI